MATWLFLTRTSLTQPAGIYRVRHYPAATSARC